MYAMAEILFHVASLVGSVVTIRTVYKEIAGLFGNGGKAPYSLHACFDRQPAVVVSFSHDVKTDVERAGYCVVAEIGTPKELSSKEIIRWSEDAAAVMERIKSRIGERPLTLALACPVTAAFTIGSLLANTGEYEVLHWEKGKYVPMEMPDVDEFRRRL